MLRVSLPVGFGAFGRLCLGWKSLLSAHPIMAHYLATRCRTVECIQVFTWNTRHVPAGLYAGVLATRCVVGAKPRGQRAE